MDFSKEMIPCVPVLMGVGGGGVSQYYVSLARRHRACTFFVIVIFYICIYVDIVGFKEERCVHVGRAQVVTINR